MPGSKRTSLEAERDRAYIAQRYLRGWSLQEIADGIPTINGGKYTLTVRTITSDIARLRDEWKERAQVSIADAKTKELAKIDALEEEAWRAWQRSVQEKKRQKTGRRETAELKATGEGTKRGTDGKQQDSVEVWKDEQYGDPRFFAVVQWCIDKRCKLLGLDAPAKHEWRNVADRIPWENLTPDQTKRLAAGEHPEKVIPGFTVN